MKPNLPSQTLTLSHKETLSPEFIRMWFNLENTGTYTQDNLGDYVKLLFRTPEQANPVLRTYTVSAVNTDAQQVAFDFLIHGNTQG